MKRSSVLAIAWLLVGCGHKPPPPVAPPPPPTEPAVKEEPKPPKKCETIEEDCVADAQTHAKIARSNLVFTPVSGWKYAQMENATVAQPVETGAAQAFTAFDL